MKHKRMLRTPLCLFFSFLLLIGSASAYTSYYLGTDNISEGNYIDYDIKGYVYLNSNTSTAINLYGMSQWIYVNSGWSVEEYSFYACAGDYSNQKEHGDTFTDPIAAGENRRVEVVWSSVTNNTVYNKGSSSSAAITRMIAGIYEPINGYPYISGGWTTYWMTNSYESDFHY